MAITCIVLDDEEMEVELLLGFIDKIPFLELAGSFTDPNKAITFLETNPVDLVFLDITMPNFAIDGMDFVNIAGDKQGYIFTTAHPKFALKSYEYNAIDFLGKPFSFERFSKAVQKARLLKPPGKEEEEMDTFKYVRVDGKFHRLDFDDICWIASERNYVLIYTEQACYTQHLSIGEVEDQLPKKLFVRVHKSNIVAKKKIELVDAKELFIKHQNQSKAIPIGIAYRKTLLEVIDRNSLRKK